MGFSLKVGIVGLPNVGKSTLFNALLKKQIAESANYPFTTIEPNVGVVEVPDPRLQKLAAVVKTEKIIPAAVEFVDIAGLVKGAAEGEGLGNKFLSHIREVDAIAHVVRSFEDPNVLRSESSFDSASDVETINTELILADLEIAEKLIAGAEKDVKAKEKDAEKMLSTLKRIKEGLDRGIPAKDIQIEPEYTRSLPLITIKPTIYVFNVAESDLKKETPLTEELKPNVVISAKIEAELSELNHEEQKDYLQELGLAESGLERLIRESYKLLGLITYFTAGEKEVRAWTIKSGTKAPAAAGVIHTDFEKGFIKAEVINWEKLIAVGGWNAAREKGLVRLEGKDYLFQDGDTTIFKFNV
ncbi:MAG: redox-regulated ATPase YchF [Candidatus Woykebacteria bacterium RIFCSPHIGHO2_12_FULL_45_10]|uniref:Ribosome-binding ATPase YchF n=1 Tax=Candidatus Woykebacteria bacterium RIFCSPHIGHO2_12_FULL_45_10 TaxID=1802603 RepID=A0A1G1WSH7_9BACT|nr:MAG: redox-regulated ATPase YchF [Candidatus Woykebacteria bacterium RIFCSPHIGHO2_12_FULL_45_10]